jgi:hypothetical protein
MDLAMAISALPNKHALLSVIDSVITQNNQPTNQSANQPISQPTNQPTNQSANQPTNQPTNQPAQPPRTDHLPPATNLPRTSQPTKDSPVKTY